MTISVLQERETSLGSGNVSSVSLAFSSTVTSLSSIHTLGTSNSSNNSLTCADDVNGTHGAALDTGDNGLGAYAADFKLDNAASGTTTVTITLALTPASFSGVAIREIGSTSGYDTHKGVNQASPGTGTDAITTTTTAPSVQPGLLSVFSFDSNGRAPTAGTGFTLGAKGWKFTTANNYMTTEHLRYTSTSAIAATATSAVGGGSDTYLTFAAFFKETSGGDTLLGQICL